MSMLRTSAVLLALSAPAFAQSGWWDKEGKPLPETEARQSDRDFSASLLITSDRDWEAKWNTPPETAPRFTEASRVSEGGELAILTVLSNPGLDASGRTDVACDFVVTRPDGSRSIDEHDMPCFNTELKTDPHNLYLTSASLKFVAEPADPRGTWSVEVTVKDRNRGVELPLRSSFVFE